MNQFKLDEFIKIITNTPVWVWGALCYLLFVGFKAMRTRIVRLPKLFVMPIVFLGLRYKLFFASNVEVYISLLLFCFVVGFITASNATIKILKELKSIELPGNYTTITISIFFFLVKYTLGYLEATRPELVSQCSFADLVISGCLIGYFLGHMSCYVYRFMKED